MRKLSIILSFLMFFFSSSFALSQNNGAAIKNQVSTKLQQKITSRQDALTKIQETVQNRIQQKTATREGRLSQIKQGIVRNYYEKMSERMWAVTERLDVLISRIESRIEIVSTETDKDMTFVNAEVDKAKTLLADTKALLTSSDGMFETAVSSSDPMSSFEILRDNINDIKMNLVEVHRILVKVIGDIYGLAGVKYLAPTVTPSSI